jgi:hypothetical protein
MDEGDTSLGSSRLTKLKAEESWHIRTKKRSCMFDQPPCHSHSRGHPEDASWWIPGSSIASTIQSASTNTKSQFTDVTLATQECGRGSHSSIQHPRDAIVHPTLRSARCCCSGPMCARLALSICSEKMISCQL